MCRLQEVDSEKNMTESNFDNFLLLDPCRTNLREPVSSPIDQSEKPSSVQDPFAQPTSEVNH